MIGVSVQILTTLALGGRAFHERRQPPRQIPFAFFHSRAPQLLADIRRAAHRQAFRQPDLRNRRAPPQEPARAIFLGSLPEVAASSFSFNPAAANPSRSHCSARSSPCARRTPRSGVSRLGRER